MGEIQRPRALGCRSDLKGGTSAQALRDHNCKVVQALRGSLSAFGRISTPSAHDVLRRNGLTTSQPIHITTKWKWIKKKKWEFAHLLRQISMKSQKLRKPPFSRLHPENPYLTRCSTPKTPLEPLQRG
jgi:hypothetical protein